MNSEINCLHIVPRDVPIKGGNALQCLRSLKKNVGRKGRTLACIEKFDQISAFHPFI